MLARVLAYRGSRAAAEDVLELLVPIDDLDAVLILSLGRLIADGGEMGVHGGPDKQRMGRTMQSNGRTRSFMPWKGLMPSRGERRGRAERDG